MAEGSDRGAFIWYELMTPDVAASKAFYDAVIGWDIDGTNSVPGGGDMDYRMINRGDGGFAGGVLAMSQDMIANGGKPGWYGYVNVPDVDAAVAAIEAAGGRRWMVQDMPGVGRMGLVSDPWGATIYVMTPTPPPGNPAAKSDVFSVDKARHVRWNELWTSDADSALRLFGEVFGWHQAGEMDMGPMGTYRFLHHGHVPIGAIGEARPDGDGPRWVTYIGVDHIDRGVGAVKEGGGKVLQGPHQIPGGEFTAICSDPHGTNFGIVGPRTK